MAVQGNVLSAFAAGAVGASAILILLLRRPAWSRRILGHSNRIEEVPSPQPDYEPGDKQPSPYASDNYRTFDPVTLGDATYPFIISERRSIR
jgi:hypothetical protein